MVLEAFAYARSKLMQDWKLVLVGVKGEFKPRLMREIKSRGLENDVICYGVVDEEMLLRVYQGASLYVDPTLYEGFGLQILEAMKCGVPVIASNTTSVPEIVGNAGILIDPRDTDGWKREMVRVLSSYSLRRKMRENGIKRASEFTWEKTAKQILNGWHELLKA
ncbi:MAG TPA: glycosyltransferase family 1 protein [Candidatus Atribacteria bacterium]|nr:glycosyltransferase family 1 protein [Candidatus Atribacteria bacterium]